MLTIRTDQMRVFSEQSRKRFEDKMVAHMQTILGENNSIPKPQIREQVIILIDSAESYEIDRESDVKKFIELFFEYSDDIFEEREVNSILKSKDLTAATKIAFLDDVLSNNKISNV